MIKVGLTGGIGSGKSTVAHFFSALGIPIIDADQIAREIVTPNSPAFKKIVSHFGTAILDTSGQINREKLRAIIFDHISERQWLEELMHPVILEEMFRQADQTKAPYCILMIPLLLEKNIRLDRVLVVDTTEVLQAERLQNRDHANKDQIKKILAAQISREERLAKADDVIANVGTLDELKNKVQQIHEKYLQLAHG